MQCCFAGVLLEKPFVLLFLNLDAIGDSGCSNGKHIYYDLQAFQNKCVKLFMLWIGTSEGGNKMLMFIIVCLDE